MATKRKLRTTTEILQLLDGLQFESELSSDDDDSYQDFIGTVLPDSDGEIVRCNSDNQEVFGDEEEQAESDQRKSGSEDENCEPECLNTQEDIQEPQTATTSVIQESIDPFGSSESELDQSAVSPSGSEQSTPESDDGSDKDELAEDGESGSGDGDSSEEETTADSSRPGPSRSVQRGRGGGIGRIHRSRGSRHGTSSGNRIRQPASFIHNIPPCANNILEKDVGFVEHDDFNPKRTPGPQVPLDDMSELDIFRMFFDDAILDLLVTATNAYAESKKEEKPAMYKQCGELTVTQLCVCKAVSMYLCMITWLCT